MLRHLFARSTSRRRVYRNSVCTSVHRLVLSPLDLSKEVLRRGGAAKPKTKVLWSTPLPLQLSGGALALVALAFVPTFAGIHLADWSVGLAYIIVFLSLGLLVRTAGQVSLCHITFMAIGAAGFSHLAVNDKVPWFAALLIAGVIAVPIGAVLAIPAVRLSPLFLALSTFGFAIVVQHVFYSSSSMFGASDAGLPAARRRVRRAVGGPVLPGDARPAGRGGARPRHAHRGRRLAAPPAPQS